jgi:hypothetical protein
MSGSGTGAGAGAGADAGDNMFCRYAYLPPTADDTQKEEHIEIMHIPTMNAAVWLMVLL